MKPRIIFSLTFLAIAGHAFLSSAQQEEIAETQSKEKKNRDVVLVTGTHIRKENLSVLTPVTSLNEEDITLSGEQDLSHIIQEQPALLASEGLRELKGGEGFVNLRALDSKRSLVLVDGKRHVSAYSSSQEVDINTIPVALIERVDVVTGGTSAIYGADAVTGVVNIITKKDFEGLDIRSVLGSTTRFDGRSFNIALTGGSGMVLNGRKGNVTFSLDYDRKQELFFKDRSLLRNNSRFIVSSNPALRFQKGDITPELEEAGIRVGDRILSQEQNLVPPALWVRAENAKSRIFLPNARFSISNTNGLIAFDVDGDGGGEVCGDTTFYLDSNQNGIEDLCETYNGRSTGYGTHIWKNGEVRIMEEGLISGFTRQYGGEGVPEDFPARALFPRNERLTLNTGLHYGIFENMHFFAHAKYSQTDNSIWYGINSFNDFLVISQDNPYIPEVLRSTLNDFVQENPEFASTAQFLVSRDQADLGENKTDTERSTFRTVLGIEGDFFNRWHYELSYNYGQTKVKTTAYSRIDDRWFAAIDAVRDPETGEIVCRSDIDPDRLAPTSSFPSTEPGFRTFLPGDGQCKPANIFGQGSISKEAIDFFMTNQTSFSRVEQQVWSGILTGDSGDLIPFLPDVLNFAVGAEYREEKGDFQPSEFNRAALLFSSGKQPISGGFDTSEIFAEILVPVIKDRFLFQDVTFGSAIRFADYSTIGKATSWQLGLNWQILPDFKMRATSSLAIRAPNIGELFSPRQPAFEFPDDPCDESNINLGDRPENRLRNCRSIGIPEGWTNPNSARIQGEEGGNPELQEERARTVTLGFILTPRFLPDFLFTLDYWNIRIDDAIEVADVQDIVDTCYDAASTENIFCRSISRNPQTLGINYFLSAQLNFASVEAKGIDFSGRYHFDLDRIGLHRFGAVDIGLLGTYLINITEYRVPSDPTAADPETLERTRPRWAVTSNFDWLPKKKWRVRNQIRYQSRQYLDEREEIEDIEDAISKTFWIYDFSVSYQWKDRISFFGGINNVTDTKPFKDDFDYPVSIRGRDVFLGVHIVY